VLQQLKEEEEDQETSAMSVTGASICGGMWRAGAHSVSKHHEPPGSSADMGHIEVLVVIACKVPIVGAAQHMKQRQRSTHWV